MQEADLIGRAQQRDDDAFAELVRPYLDLAFRTAWIITRDASDAEDATQTALIKAHGAIDRVRPEAPFRPWFLAIVANEAKNGVRSRTRRQTDPLSDEMSATIVADPINDPATHAEANERSAWLAGHVDRLAEMDRLVIHCRYSLDLSEDEAAQVLGCARGTVKSRLHRALGRLRQQIEADPQHQENRP